MDNLNLEDLTKKIEKIIKPFIEELEVDLVELNEAFAAQSLAVLSDMPIPEDKLNVNGGAIALGHPIGASGSVILTKLIHELHKRKKAKLGLASLCIGGGMGIAMIVEKTKE